MDWKEDIYRFKIVKVVNLSLASPFRKHYQLKSYDKDGKELNYPFGQFGSAIKTKNYVKDLMKQMPHPCTLDEKIEFIEIKKDRSEIEQDPLSNPPSYKIPKESVTEDPYYTYTHAHGKRTPAEFYE